MPDAFPARTHGTWIEARLAGGAPGRADVNHHVMSLYAQGLEAYYRGSSFCRRDRGRALGEPAEVVSGFFAERLGRAGFFEAWQASGKRLRHWLINAFRFHLQERLRRELRAGAAALPEELAAEDQDPIEAYHRTCALTLVRQALADTREECDARGLDDHWRMFELRYVHGLPPRCFIDRFGVDSVRAAGMIRVARNRFERVLRGLLGRELDTLEQIGAELVDLRRTVRSRPEGSTR